MCFDEFHVSDIADAMMLGRLMEALFDSGVVFCITSNYPPDGLYPNGLQRDRLLPTIALLNERLDVIRIDAGVDYRLRALEQADIYHVPADAAAEAQMMNTFSRIASGGGHGQALTVAGRELPVIHRAPGVVWFDFRTLCGGPRSQNDYLEIAQQFHTVILSEVPRMSAAMASEARRFVWLVDVFYDQRVKLLMSAECPPEELYTSGAMAGEFHRTVSRIVEMQSREYLEAPRRGVSQGLR